MKKIGRTKIVCYKKLPCGVWDIFKVVVKTADKSEAVKNYQSMGYEVRC